MHIAIVRTEFIAARGGAEAYAVRLARAWLGQGHRISIVCRKHDADDARGMDVVRVSRPKVLGPFKHNWFAKRAGRAAAETGADAVLCLARAYPGDVLRLGDGLHKAWLEARYPDAARRKRATLNPRQSELLKLERELFKPGRFKAYVANSAMIKDAVVSMYGVDAAAIHVVPNGVDTSTFSLNARERRTATRAAHGIPAEAKLVLFSGMDFRRKGLMEAARGFERLAGRRDDVWFACVGRGDNRAAQELLRQRAVFLPESRDISAWYGAADVFVLPTMHDPSANAVTESLACGTPVVTSLENGARQHIVEGVNGIVLKRRDDAAEIADALERLLETDPARVAAAAPLTSTADNAAAILSILKQARA